MDYGKYLVLYSAGADSTYLISQEKSARHLLFYSGYNEEKNKLAVVNANRLERYITVVPQVEWPTADGETNEIHALYDTQMALNASIRAVSHGMSGIVMGFNKDDLGIDVDAVTSIMRRAEPNFDIVLPLRDMYAADIRNELDSMEIQFISCMHSKNCGYCPKCIRGY